MRAARIPTRLNRKIRLLRRSIKDSRNRENAYRDEAVYHQAFIDHLTNKFHLAPIEGGNSSNE